jgi:hypothetical protein
MSKPVDRTVKATYDKARRRTKKSELRIYEQSRKTEKVSYNRARHAANPANAIAWNRKYRTTLRGRASVMLNTAKQRSKRLGTPCDLTIEFILIRLERLVCPRTGFWFDLSAHPTIRGAKNAFAPSLDRIDNQYGYVQDNVEVVCTMYNIMKNEYDEITLHAFCEAVLRNKRR